MKKKNGRSNILLKVEDSQKALFKKNANRYTGGNMALWLRSAASLKLTAQQAAAIKRDMTKE